MPSWFGGQNQDVSTHKASGSDDHGPNAKQSAQQDGKGVVNGPPKVRLGVDTLYEPNKPRDATVE